LDISVIANRALFRCMKVLLTSQVRLKILYAEAGVYHPTQRQFADNRDQWIADDEMGLEQGVSDVRISRQFPGQQLDLLPDCVILFPSFKANRSNAVLAKVDPALLSNAGENVIWLLGVPHHNDDRWRLAAMREINRLDQSSICHEVSTFQYKETLQQLNVIYEERCTRANITLSPLGSKMQALGSVLFCQMHPDVRVILSVPKQYNASHYSSGCKGLWEIDFGAVPTLSRTLDDVGTLTLERLNVAPT
jgi:hypothetical protein